MNGSIHRERTASEPQDHSSSVAHSSLYERANGYNYDAVKVFMPAGMLRVRLLLS
jgi:hypothetical protein